MSREIDLPKRPLTYQSAKFVVADDLKIFRRECSLAPVSDFTLGISADDEENDPYSKSSL